MWSRLREVKHSSLVIATCSRCEMRIATAPLIVIDQVCSNYTMKAAALKTLDFCEK